MNHPSSQGLDPRELPAVNPPAIPLWAESYVYEVTCPDVTADFFMHIARQPFNNDLWRDTFVCDLGGNEVYLWKGFGKGAHPEREPRGFFAERPWISARSALWVSARMTNLCPVLRNAQ